MDRGLRHHPPQQGRAVSGVLCLGRLLQVVTKLSGQTWFLCVPVAVCVLLALSLTACRQGEGGSTPSMPRPHGQLSVTPPIPAGPLDVFEDVTARSGIKFVQQYCDERIANILESNGSGAAILDYDQDGWMDIYLVNPGPLDGVTHHLPGTVREPNRLYRNQGDGTFEDVTEQARVPGNGYAFAAAAADYDNDGFPDLYVVQVGKNLLYHNRGDRTFEEVTDRAGVGDTGTGIGAVWVDVDRDGWLDLFVANYLTYDPGRKLYFNPDAYPGPLSYQSEFNRLYRNKGDGTFEDISGPAGIRIAGHRAMSVCAFDCDDDGDDDLYICNDATPNLLLVNDGKGCFRDVAPQAQVAFNALGEAAGSMTAAVGDYNGDQILDLFVSRLGYGSLYAGRKDRIYEDRMMASGLGSITAQYVGWGNNFFDFDNDGDLDALVVNGDAHRLVGGESLLLENRGDGTFANAVEKAGACFRTKIRARGSVVLDHGNDGRQDLLITAMGDRVFLLRNRSASGHHWITLALEGTRSNRDGFGARIRLSAGGRTYYTQARCQAAFLGTADPRTHLGLGTAGRIDKVEIHWPSGQVQTLTDVAADRILRIKEPGERSS